MNIDTSHFLATIQHNLRVFCNSTLVPCISPNTETYLRELLQQYKPKHILEIGTACGYSLFTMGTIIQSWGGYILGCERAYPNRVEINKTISLARSYGLNNINCLYGPFLQLNPKFLIQNSEFLIQNCFDLVFIDAQKSEYPLYLDYLINNNLIDKSTVLLFDDVIKYQDKMSGIKDKLQEYGYNIEIKQLDEDDGILLALTA